MPQRFQISATATIRTLLLIVGLASCLSITVLDISLSLAFLLFVFFHARQIRFSEIVRCPIFRFSLAFIAASFLSAIFSDQPPIGLYRIWAIIFDMSPFWLARYCISNNDDPKRIMAAVFVSLGISCLVAVWQGFHGIERAGGAFHDLTALTLSGQIGVVFPYLLCLLTINSNPTALIFPRMHWLLLPCMLGGIVANGIRTTWIVAGITILACTAVSRRFRIHLLAMIILLVGMILVQALYNPMVYKKLTDSATIIQQVADHPDYERIYKWQGAWKMFLDHPLLGVGPGRFKQEFAEHYKPPEAKERRPAHAHNNFVHVLAENGIVGFVPFVMLFGFILYTGIRKYRITSKKALPLAVLLSTSALLIQGMTEYNFENFAVMRVYWLLLGISWRRLEETV